MNGPDHYREAERLLEEAEAHEEPGSSALWCLELAKLHTALAQVAATALNSDGRNGPRLLAVGSAHESRFVQVRQEG
jgi:hypothetical protein